MDAVTQLAAIGWHVKVMTDHNGPALAYRAWLRWPKGPLPHKEESGRFAELDEALAWLVDTAASWDFE